MIGGVVGHQVGGGRGRDLATVGGAVAGGAAGSQVGRLGIGGQQAETRDVQRCENVPSQAKPDHWDVTYEFRGQEHRNAHARGVAHAEHRGRQVVVHPLPHSSAHQQVADQNEPRRVPQTAIVQRQRLAHRDAEQFPIHRQRTIEAAQD